MNTNSSTDTWTYGREAKVPKEDMASLTALISGTAPLSPDVVDAFQETYGIPILSNYGASEFAGAICGWIPPIFEHTGRASAVPPGGRMPVLRRALSILKRVMPCP